MTGTVWPVLSVAACVLSQVSGERSRAAVNRSAQARASLSAGVTQLWRLGR
jgi:hypothetical protein